jgi:hypothetical protein
MSRLKVETVWRRIVENKSGRFSAKDRLFALEQIPRPSLSLLRRLLSAKRTPRRLRLLAAQRYSLAIARRELVRNAQHKGEQV